MQGGKNMDYIEKALEMGAKQAYRVYSARMKITP